MNKSTNFLNKIINVKIDRPMGSKHPKHGFIYPVNYGYVPNTVSGDGEELDCYVLGVFEPLETFTGKCIAIIHRTNDNDDKLIIVPENKSFSNAEIRVLTDFQERFFQSEIIRDCNTSETIQNLIDRRSVRKFSQEQIKDAELKQILDAGTYAPSGMNRQSPKIVVIQNIKVITRLAKLNSKFLWSNNSNEKADPFYGAPTILVVLANKNNKTYIEDGSLVLGNLMNAAHSLGIGSCWIHRAKEEFESTEGKALLKEWNISEDYVGIGHCILGYPANYAIIPPKNIKADYITYIK